MTQKNNYNLFILMLGCTILLSSSFPYQLYASQQPTSNTTSSPMIDDEELTEEDLKEIEEALEEKKEGKKTISSAKNLIVPEPTFLTRVYNTLVPIILVAMSGAIATGIATSTQSLIKLLLKREAVKTQENSLIATVEKIIKLEYPENSSEILQKLSNEQKLAIGANFFSEKEQFTFEQQKRTTSPSAIVKQIMLIGMLNIGVLTMGELARIVSLMFLQALMPATNR